MRAWILVGLLAGSFASNTSSPTQFSSIPPTLAPSSSAPTRQPTAPSASPTKLLFREVFPVRSPRVPLSYVDRLPRNLCAPDTVNFRPLPWSFRRRRLGIEAVSSITGSFDGDWLRFTGRLSVLDVATPNITWSRECNEPYLYVGNWTYSVVGIFLQWQAQFVFEYRSKNGLTCNLFHGPDSDIFADGSPDTYFKFTDINVTNGVVGFYNNGLRPLISGWLSTRSPAAALILSSQVVGTVRDFCGLPFIQCFSTSAATDRTDLMMSLLHPDVYAGNRPAGVNVTSLFDSSQLTAFAVLLGGDATFSLANPPGDISWTQIQANKFASVLTAMFMLDLSFNPGLQLALNAPLDLRVLLLTGSPGVELQWTGDNTLGAKGSANCSTSFCQNVGKSIFDFSGSGFGKHPSNLEVLSLSIDRSNWDGFYLRPLQNLLMLQIDDGDFYYPYPFETVNPFAYTNLAQMASDSWPFSVLPRYDSSCRDMYFDRYFSYWPNLFSASDLPPDWNRTAVLSAPSPSNKQQQQANITSLTPFAFECQGTMMPLRHFAVLGLPISGLKGNCLPSTLASLQIEGSLVADASKLFGTPLGSANKVDVRLSHNVLLSDVSAVLQLNSTNLLLYGNSQLNLRSQPISSASYIDASFSEVVAGGWSDLAWSAATSITCRGCGISAWPNRSSLPKVTNLRIPMNPNLAFNVSQLKLGAAWSLFNMSPPLNLVDLSYSGLFGSLTDTQFPFPSATNLAYNSIASYSSDTYASQSIFNPQITAAAFSNKILNLRGNLLMGNEPPFSNLNINLAANQISCNGTRSQQCLLPKPICSACVTYCGAPILAPMPRILSSLKSSSFSLTLDKTTILNYTCLNGSSLTGFMCPSSFCAFLRFSNGYVSASNISRKLIAARLYDPLDVKFELIRLTNMSGLCATQNQMPIMKNDYIGGCEVAIELWFGNQTSAQFAMKLPPVMLLRQCSVGEEISDGNCAPCPFGKYAPQREVTATADLSCIACPVGATTKDVGSRQLQDCICGDGTWGEPLNPLKCKPNKLCCRGCPLHATCVNNSKVPFPDAGYIRDLQDASIILECLPHSACVNNNCTTGYVGNGCASCDQQFYRLQQQCLACPGSDGFVVFLGILIFFGASLFLLKASKPDISKIYTISITVGFVQIISIFASFPVSWPPAARVMFDIFSFVNFNIDLFSPECALDLNFYEKWGLKMGMPLIMVGFFLIILVVVRFVPFLRKYYIKFLLWNILASMKRVVPQKDHLSDLKQADRLQGKGVEDESVTDKSAVEGIQMVVVRKSIGGEASQFSFGVERVTPLSAAEQYEIDREWEESHLFSRFVHAFVTSCCIGYTFLAKTSTQIYNCVDTGGLVQVIRYDPSVVCFDDEWYTMQAPAVAALMIYTFGIPIFFSFILFRAHLRGSIETPMFFAHFGQLVLPYRSQYWYWELVQIGRKLLTVLLIDFAANSQGDNTYSQITGVFVVLLIFLVLQEFIKPYEFTWCNRLAFSWTVISLMVVVSALFFVQSTLTEDQRSDYGIGLLFSCIVGFAIALYTAKKENARASAKTRVAPRKDFLVTGQEEQTVVNTIFGKSIGEPLYRKTRGLHPTARAEFYQRLVKLHSTSSEAEPSADQAEDDIARLRVRLSVLESKSPNGVSPQPSGSRLSIKPHLNLPNPPPPPYVA